MSKDFRLTTKDNPSDPFGQFTLSLLYDEEHERAIDEIIANDARNIYKKVERKNIKDH